MNAVSADGAVTVRLLAMPETTPAALYGLFEVFSSVGVTWRELTGEPAAGPAMDVRIVTGDGQPFRCATGTPLTPHQAIANDDRADLVVVADLALSPDVDPRGRWPAEAAWVRAQFARGATVCSVCTGSILLAESGLLDGCEASTHWSAAGLFARCYPAVTLRPERILCPASPGHRIISSGGAASWEDLALYLVARYCGEAEAIRAAKLFLIGDRSAGQLPFTAMLRPRRHEDAVIGGCQQWIAEHYAAPVPVARLIEHSGLPARTFKRRFRAATGYSPVEYVQILRVEEAKQLLESTDQPTDAVALAVGYQDQAFFRRLFKRRTGITPARYRQRFRGIARLAPAR